MTKNVNVVDDLGNRYVPTYAKRAKGLVKNGRARWVDENTICLACPPDELNLEDTKMDKNKINPVDGMVVEVKDSEMTAVANGVTMRDILNRMDKIIAQGDELANIIAQVKNLPVDFNGKGRSEDIVDIYSKREATNMKMLAMLDKMYDDMMGKSEKQTIKTYGIDAIAKMDFAGMMPETAKVVLDALMGKTNT